MSKDHHIDGVIKFSARFGVPLAERPTLLDYELFLYRLQFLHEELHEFLQAHRSGNLVEAADALLDLEYVLHGTAAMMGLGRRWHDLWRCVHLANMAKVPAPSMAASKRKSQYDIVKPLGWRGPEEQLRKIIAQEIDDAR